MKRWIRILPCLISFVSFTSHGAPPRSDNLVISKALAEFYDAFANKNAEGMVKHYASTVNFSDPIFPRLQGEMAKNMWRMICKGSTDLKLKYQILSVKNGVGRVRWEAKYTFPKTGNKVRNIVHSELTFRDGLIVSHRDTYNLWLWSSQALGPAGIALGWTPQVRSRIRGESAEMLRLFSNQFEPRESEESPPGQVVQVSAPDETGESQIRSEKGEPLGVHCPAAAVPGLVSGGCNCRSDRDCYVGRRCHDTPACQIVGLGVCRF